ncbi:MULTISPECIES: hypothetical protein [Haloarcula]|uniref:hypothetical protein n=1 Tax=Haloarcula TaxID=2237 RepID=UPI0023EC62AD|nr:hypothetical protein [Halomicroarcula sp. XH51]
MRDYTFVRVETEVGPAARVLRRVPGVAVGDESGEPAERDDFDAWRAGPGETPPPNDTAVDVSAGTDDDSEGGPTDRLPPVVREYGLLVVGVLFLLVGVASAVLWWLRRRNADEAADQPPMVDSVDEPVDEWRPDSDEDTATADTGDVAAGRGSEPTGRPRTVELTDTAESTVLREEAASAGPSADAAGTASAVEAPPAGGEGSAGDGPADGVQAATEDDAASADPTSGAAGSVDVAPLLGMGFLAVTAAVVKWAQRDTGGER